MDLKVDLFRRPIVDNSVKNQEIKTAVDDLRKMFRKRYGNLVRPWRYLFDPSMAGYCTQMEFFAALRKQRNKYINVRKAWEGLTGHLFGDNVLFMEMFCPNEWECLHQFSSSILHTFGDDEDRIRVLQGRHVNRNSMRQYQSGLIFDKFEHGRSANVEDHQNGNMANNEKKNLAATGNTHAIKAFFSGRSNTGGEDLGIVDVEHFLDQQNSQNSNVSAETSSYRVLNRFWSYIKGCHRQGVKLTGAGGERLISRTQVPKVSREEWREIFLKLQLPLEKASYIFDLLRRWNPATKSVTWGSVGSRIDIPFQLIDLADLHFCLNVLPKGAKPIGYDEHVVSALEQKQHQLYLAEHGWDDDIKGEDSNEGSNLAQKYLGASDGDKIREDHFNGEKKLEVVKICDIQVYEALMKRRIAATSVKFVPPFKEREIEKMAQKVLAETSNLLIRCVDKPMYSYEREKTLRLYEKNVANLEELEKHCLTGKNNSADDNDPAVLWCKKLAVLKSIYYQCMRDIEIYGDVSLGEKMQKESTY